MVPVLNVVWFSCADPERGGGGSGVFSHLLENQLSIMYCFLTPELLHLNDSLN